LLINPEAKNINAIKLSAFVDLVKLIVGQNCYINLLDYSCNSPSMYIPKDQLTSSKYMTESDIEQGLPNNWGGKHLKKRRNKKSNRRNKKSIKRRHYSKKRFVKSRRL